MMLQDVFLQLNLAGLLILLAGCAHIGWEQFCGSLPEPILGAVVPLPLPVPIILSKYVVNML